MIVLFFIQSCVVWNESNDAEFSLASSDDVAEEYGQSLSTIQATLFSHGIVTCENPALREVQPMFRASFGNDWDNQADQGHISPSGHWIGGSGVIVEDFNQDELLDVYAPSSERNLIFFQQEDGTFTEESSTSLAFDNDTIGIVTTGGSAADFDDGFVNNIVLHTQVS